MRVISAVLVGLAVAFLTVVFAAFVVHRLDDHGSHDGAAIRAMLDKSKKWRHDPAERSERSGEREAGERVRQAFSNAVSERSLRLPPGPGRRVHRGRGTEGSGGGGDPSASPRSRSCTAGHFPLPPSACRRLIPTNNVIVTMASHVTWPDEYKAFLHSLRVLAGFRGDLVVLLQPDDLAPGGGHGGPPLRRYLLEEGTPDVNVVILQFLVEDCVEIGSHGRKVCSWRGWANDGGVAAPKTAGEPRGRLATLRMFMYVKDTAAVTIRTPLL